MESIACAAVSGCENSSDSAETEEGRQANAAARLTKAGGGVKGKELNSGIRGGLWDRKHSDVMGLAIYLFGWCVHRQTTQRDGVGLVLRGKPLTYELISEDTGWETWKLRRWMKILQDAGYLAVKYTTYHRMIIRVLKAKKFSAKQLQFPQVFPQSISAECAREAVRNVHESRNDFSLNRKNRVVVGVALIPETPPPPIPKIEPRKADPWEEARARLFKKVP